MQITTEQLLIGLLATSKAPRGIQAMVFIMLDKEEQQKEMCFYLSDNPEATDEDIVAMAKQIAKKSGC